MKIKVSKYNEVNPAELERLFKAGARLIKSESEIGELVKVVTVNGKRLFVCSDDEIEINNVKLPTAAAGEDYFGCEIVINGRCE